MAVIILSSFALSHVSHRSIVFIYFYAFDADDDGGGGGGAAFKTFSNKFISRMLEM